MCRLAGAFDFRLAVFLQPLVYFNSDKIGSPYAERQYERIRAGFKELTARNSPGGRCSFTDLSGVFRGSGRNPFWDNIHVDNEGNAFVASRIYARVADPAAKP